MAIHSSEKCDIQCEEQLFRQINEEVIMMMMILFSYAQAIAGVHSDHPMTQCAAPGGRQLDGDSLGHTPVKSA